MHQVHHITKHIGVLSSLDVSEVLMGLGNAVKKEVKPMSKLTGSTNLTLDNINKNLAEKFEKMKQCNDTKKIIKSIFAYKERTSIRIKDCSIKKNSGRSQLYPDQHLFSDWLGGK